MEQFQLVAFANVDRKLYLSALTMIPVLVDYLILLIESYAYASTFLYIILAGVDSMINILGHEIAETVSDPELNAWLDTTVC